MLTSRVTHLILSTVVGTVFIPVPQLGSGDRGSEVICPKAREKAESNVEPSHPDSKVPNQ